MYHVNQTLKSDLEEVRQCEVKKTFDICSAYVSKVFTGKQRCTTLFAKSILSMRFGIPVNDKKIDKLLDIYFIKTKEE